jgi:ribosomal peptide maturation radical SAM protein 1
MITPNKREQPKVILVCMPWTSLLEPSLGLGILKSKLIQEEIDCRVFYGHIQLLKYMRTYTYEALAINFAINDWMFTACFEQETDEAQEKILHQFVQRMWEGKVFESYSNINSYDDLLQLMYKIRNVTIPRYLNDCLENILSDNPTMVGFTCLFDQTFASLALAKLIKEKSPDMFIAMGGYALEGPMSKQIIDSFSFVDCVVTGEGEPAIVPLAQVSVGKGSLATIPGAHYRESGKTVKSPVPQIFINLNDSPFPDYDDFPEQIKQLKETHQVDIKWQTIPIEASRGCWWGQKSHCTFCGIDDHTMTYRQKNPERVIEMLDMLNKKYERAYFRFSDYILPNNYYNELLPKLAREEHKLGLHCEIKANITSEKARLLHDAGFIAVQPGIESFSTPILRIMKKGVTAIQNIFTVLLGTRYSIVIHYNLLYGFPDDTEEAYSQMLKTIPKLYHIQPPENETQIAITRFAPLEQAYSAQNLLHAHELYNIIFSRNFLQENSFNLDNYCYQFNKPYANSPKLDEYYSLLSYQVAHWKENFRKREVVLIYEDHEQFIQFTDTRYNAKGTMFTLNKICRDIFMKCEMKIASIKTMQEELSGIYTGDEVSNALLELDNYRVVFIEDDKILGLALLLEDYKNFKIDKLFRDNLPLESKYINYELKSKINLKYELTV